MFNIFAVTSNSTTHVRWIELDLYLGSEVQKHTN